MIRSQLNDYINFKPEDIFIHYNNHDITYENMAYSIEDRIKSMQAINIKKGELVGLYFNNSLNLLEVLFACIELQVIPLIIPNNFTSNEFDNLNKNIKFDYLITNWDKLDHLKNSKIPTFPIEELSPGIGGCASSKKNKLNDNQIACLLLTSGTTGSPKIVQISLKNIIESCNAWNKQLRFKKKDIYLCCLPIHHIGGLSIIFRSLLYGFKVVLIDEFDKDLCIDKIIKYKVSLISFVPTMLSRVIKSKEVVKLHNSLRGIILSGSYSNSRLIKDAIDKKLNIYKSYGMTESCSGITGFWVKDNMKYIDSVGTAHDKVNIKIIKDEIFLQGPSIVNEYYNDEKIENWYKTNDIGYINKDGFLYVLNRNNHPISGGENIDIKEVEKIIYSHPNVKKVFIRSTDDQEWGKRIIAYIKSDNLDEGEIKNWLKTKISNYKIPKEFIFINSMD